MPAAARTGFVTTSSRGLRHDAAPMRLYYQAKRVGAWDPQALDLTADAGGWGRLTDLERDLLVRLTALFQAGEEGMMLDLAPWLLSVARGGQLEDGMFLATLLSDEAKHTDFFRRVLDEVCGVTGDLHHYHTPSFRGLFYQELPRVMHRLLDEPSAGALAEALVTYTIVGEGVLSETGHHLYGSALRRQGLLPGVLEGLRRVQRDEARHMTYGVYVLSRLVAEDPGCWQIIQRRMDGLLVTALDIVSEFFAPYGTPPFGLTLADTVHYAMERFARRSTRIERAQARGAAIAAAVGEPLQDLVDWLTDELRPLGVRRGAGQRTEVAVLDVAHPSRAASLLITQDVLDHYLADEIISVLLDAEVPRRLAGEPGLRLMCLEVSGRILVQRPSPS